MHGIQAIRPICGTVALSEEPNPVATHSGGVVIYARVYYCCFMVTRRDIDDLALIEFVHVAESALWGNIYALFRPTESACSSIFQRTFLSFIKHQLSVAFAPPDGRVCNTVRVPCAACARLTLW